MYTKCVLIVCHESHKMAYETTLISIRALLYLQYPLGYTSCIDWLLKIQNLISIVTYNEEHGTDHRLIYSNCL